MKHVGTSPRPAQSSLGVNLAAGSPEDQSRPGPKAGFRPPRLQIQHRKAARPDYDADRAGSRQRKSPGRCRHMVAGPHRRPAGCLSPSVATSARAADTPRSAARRTTRHHPPPHGYQYLRKPSARQAGNNAGAFTHRDGQEPGQQLRLWETESAIRSCKGRFHRQPDGLCLEGNWKERIGWPSRLVPASA